MVPKPSADAKTVEENVDEEEAGAHLDGIADGCGCTEIWEHLSEQREG